MEKKLNDRKELVFTIEYRVHPEDAGAISEIMAHLRETGSAEVLDVRFEKEKK